MGNVEVVAYRPSWPLRFAVLRDAYAAALWQGAVPVVAIEHVGSTAVPGLAAKPVIDVDVVVEPADVERAVAALGHIGFTPSTGVGVPGRTAFVTPERFRPSNTYVVEAGSTALRNHLAVRDVLRADDGLRDEYAATKTRASATAADVTAYLAARDAVLNRILRRAGLSDADRAEIAAANRAIAARGALG